MVLSVYICTHTGPFVASFGFLLTAALFWGSMPGPSMSKQQRLPAKLCHELTHYIAASIGVHGVCPFPSLPCSHHKEGTRGTDTETADEEQGGGDGNKRVTIKPSPLINIICIHHLLCLISFYITPPRRLI